MTQTAHSRLFGRRLARELTANEVACIGGAHGDGGTSETGFTTADLCADGSITSPACGDRQTDFGDGGF